MDHWNTLTPRQRQVAELIAQGYDRATIIRTLGVAEKTVDTFRRQAFAKLGVENNVELARLAIACGIVSVPSLEGATWTPRDLTAA